MKKANLVPMSVSAVTKLGFESICLYYKLVSVFWVLDDIFDKHIKPTGKDLVNSTLCEERIMLKKQFESIWENGEPLPHLSS